ncbi:hypothetical protein Dcar01_03115 [Deinococcus carri]|uniref:ArsR family transcriptional regulator n=1 Tax=Deinococcus carri TaxID=1211323 RepID=A0ABP9WC94_9DEIO
MTDLAALEARVRALEDRLAVLEEERPGGPPPAGDFWALDTLTARYPAGALVFAGHVKLPTGEQYGWQEGESLPDLLEADWQAAAPALAALGHPLRLTLLRAVLHGEQTTADLQAHPGLAGAGKLYHHLRELQAAGWLVPEGRGRYVVPAQRVIPLLVVLRATGQVEAGAAGGES